MNAQSLLIAICLSLIHAATASTGSNITFESTATFPAVHPAKTIIPMRTPAKPADAKQPNCQYQTMSQCLSACGTGLCMWCSGNGKYACVPKA